MTGRAGYCWAIRLRARTTAGNLTDTQDSSLPEGGWVRLVLTRLIEDHLGYSSTCQELVNACERISNP